MDGAKPDGQTVKVGILGASGYTGGELLRLLLRHPRARLTLLTADRNAGKPIDVVFPHLAGYGLPLLQSVEQADLRDVDVAFCGLPHGTTQEVIASLPHHLKVI